MQNIRLDIGNNAQNILPVPYQSNPVPSVESPSNYGSSPYAMAVQKPVPRQEDESQYCNFLQPAPRDQRLNVPYEGNKNCPDFKTQPYGKDSCYLMDSKSQGVTGIVCNQAGGSDNADFIRGNQFGTDYPLNQDLNKKKLEYTFEKPVQIPMEMQNPMVIYDKNTFYPEPSFDIRKNKNFITYPLQQNYTENGLPTYTYPYKTMNPIFQDPTQDITDSIETFDNKRQATTSIFFVMLLIVILMIFLYMR
jgi:hypothetical protein